MRYRALAAANNGMWIAADFSPPDISECFFLVSRCGGTAGGEQLKFEGVPGAVIENRGEHFPVGVARIARAMVMDHRPEQRAQLGQPVGTEAVGVAVEHAGHRGLLLGPFFRTDPADPDRHARGHRLGTGVGIHRGDQILRRQHPGVDLLGERGQQRILQHRPLAFFQQDALVLHSSAILRAKAAADLRPALVATSTVNGALPVRSAW